MRADSAHGLEPLPLSQPVAPARAAGRRLRRTGAARGLPPLVAPGALGDPARRLHRHPHHPLGASVRHDLHRPRDPARPGRRDPGDHHERRHRGLGALDRHRRGPRHARPLRPGGRRAQAPAAAARRARPRRLPRQPPADDAGRTPRTAAPSAGGLKERRPDLYCSVRSRAISSVGERFVHTEEVTGSNPVSPTGREPVRSSGPALPLSGHLGASDLGPVFRILSGSRGLARTSAALSSVVDALRRLPPPPCICTHQPPLGSAGRFRRPGPT
ncbi:hypothetical protein SGPA1_20329 [Streptomyces misionensis JCM 4497]